MRVPSLKALLSVFPEHGKELRRILKADRKTLEETKAGDMLIRACYHSPCTRVLRLAVLNEVGEFFGVEYAHTTKGEYAEYLNTGDSYEPTIIAWRGNYRIQSIGDFIETMERQGIRFL